MRCFKISDYAHLQTFLLTSNIHDGKFLHAVYDQITKSFAVHIENTIWNESFDMVFSNISYFFSISDYKWGDNDQINCLTVISNTEDLPSCINVCECKDKLCFVWEMFSGNLIYIICSEFKVLQGQEDGSVVPTETTE